MSNLIMSEPLLLIKQYIRIGNIVPQYNLTAITGLPATGKTYTIIKFLNMHGITPVVLNFDETVIPDTVKALSISGDCFSKLHTYTDLKDLTIIIDTYQLSAFHISKNPLTEAEQLKYTQYLQALVKEQQCTVIVIGHTEDYAGKDGVFNANPSLIRGCAEHIAMYSVTTSRKTDNEVNFHTILRKGRGIGGSKVFDNWMRQPMLNPLTNKMC